MKFDKTEVFNFDGALRGMRNPLESWGKSDGLKCEDYEGKCKICPNFQGWGEDCKCLYIIGDNDLNLAKKLILSGKEHAKFLRQIFVSVDITAPLYWWKEFDTYKVGTVANSTSTMHKIQSKPITLDCFEISDFSADLTTHATLNDKVETELIGHIENCFIPLLEQLRERYIETKDKRYWKELIRWLPESWLQTRTVTMSFANLRDMYFQRRNHKLTEWSVDFIKWLSSLPYAQELIIIEKENTHE